MRSIYSAYDLPVERVVVGNSVQPLLMVMPSVNPLSTVLGMGTFQCLCTLIVIL